MVDLIRLPAQGCIHYRSGGCAAAVACDIVCYDKARCVIHAFAEKAFDDLLDRAEAFSDGIGPATLLSAWEKRLTQICDNFVCADRVQGDDPLVSCAFLLDDLCRKKLPDCPGRCHLYKEAIG
ncbi:MAG: hypothetical protein AB1921_14905 [Thermodesulfobacteriota bacterium]